MIIAEITRGREKEVDKDTNEKLFGKIQLDTVNSQSNRANHEVKSVGRNFYHLRRARKTRSCLLSRHSHLSPNPLHSVPQCVIIRGNLHNCILPLRWVINVFICLLSFAEHYVSKLLGPRSGLFIFLRRCSKFHPWLPAWLLLYRNEFYCQFGGVNVENLRRSRRQKHACESAQSMC